MILLILAVFWPAFRSHAAGRPAEAWVALVNADSLSRTVEDLCGFETRYEFTEQRQTAAKYLLQRFQAYCGEAEYDNYIFWKNSNSFGSANVIGIIRGAEYPDSVIVIGAHYDSISEDDPMNVAPGADDNASGVAGLVEMARLLSGTIPKMTLEFVSFSAEEIGFCGSRHYAQAAVEKGKKIKAMINMDMIAYPQPGEWTVRIDGDSASQWLTGIAGRMAETYTNLTAYRRINSDRYSDHASFREQGFPALCIIENNPLKNPHYHTPSDVFSTLDFAFAAEIVKTALATVIELGGAMTSRKEEPASFVGPDCLILYGNYPNPFNTATFCTYSLPEASHVTLKIFDSSGREIRSLLDEYQPAGVRTVIWDGCDGNARPVDSGIYILRLRTNREMQAQKMLLVK
ncbi:M20/M25/M40 family metallo-hydrolase [bacterium]|nr:M20/M25/M40 family metallo-hydrolase [bacterium]